MREEFFSTAGRVTVNYIAKWNGSSWSALGSGIGNTNGFASVSVLAVSGSDLYARGRFTSAGGNPANNIAKWNGSSWSALGSGNGPGGNAYVSALAVAGAFRTAGEKVSPYIARAALNGLPPLLSTSTFSGGQMVFKLTGMDGTDYIVQGSTNLSSSNWLSLQTNAAPFWFTNSPGQPQQFYRAVAAP